MTYCLVQIGHCYRGAKPRAGDWASPKFQLWNCPQERSCHHIAMKFSHTIEREFGYCARTPPGVDEGQQPFLSISLAAELAGCGTKSLAGSILNSDHGFVYLAAVISTLPLPSDKPLATSVCPAQPCIDMYKDTGYTPCTAVCDASSGGCLSGKIENGQWTDRYYDIARCTARVYNHWIPSFQKILADTLDEPDKETRRMKVNSSLFTRTLWSMTYSNISQGQCFECIRVCPVDAETRKLS